MRRLKLMTNPAGTPIKSPSRPRAAGHRTEEEANPGAQDEHANEGLIVALFDPVKALLPPAYLVRPGRLA